MSIIKTLNDIRKNNFEQQVIYNIKLSQFDQVIEHLDEDNFFRITGNVSDCDKDNKIITLISNEPSTPTSPSNGTSNLIQYKVEIVFNLLDNLNLNDFNWKHDLIQFVCFKKKSMKYCEAVSFRIIHRCSLRKYYNAINIQNNYLLNKFK
jgi:hypothetical protein